MAIMKPESSGSMLSLAAEGLTRAQSSSAVCRPGRVPRPVSRTSLRLPPLDASPVASPPGGHVSMVRSLRRSQSKLLPWDQSDVAAPQAGWGRPVEAREEETESSAACGGASRASPQALRVRRLRRSMDICGDMLAKSSNVGTRRSASQDFSRPGSEDCSDASPGSEVQTSASPLPGSPAKGSAARESSAGCVAAPGAEAAAGSKARAVAMLQKFFFEELANGSGQDANSAAVAALRRLTESAPADLPAEALLSDPLSQNPHLIEVTDVAPVLNEMGPRSSSGLSIIPQRPSAGIGSGPRRPAPMVNRQAAKVKVQS